MKKNNSVLFSSGLLIQILFFSIFICASCTTRHEDIDVLDIIYSTADDLQMKVISDFSLRGGDLYGKQSPESIYEHSDEYIQKYYTKYGGHSSFWGWYLNTEINPIETTDSLQSDFWRSIWKFATSKCHKTDPGSKVTISPFFILDKDEYRGFKFRPPEYYEEWWYHTLLETDIDIIMLQDSGAEHLSFYTLNDRLPFIQAFAKACKKAGKEFWLNVETGQVKAENWEEAINMEHNKRKAWEFTDIDWLKEKLDAASGIATGIVNWGYYPLMNPVENDTILTINQIDGQEVDISSREKNYDAYFDYYKNLPDTIPTGKLTIPKLNGTLWFLPEGINRYGKRMITHAVMKELRAQKKIGFEYVWICNTPSYFDIRQ